MSESNSNLTQKLDWSNVPLGHVLNAHAPPSPAEAKAFEGWICPVNAPPNWRRMSFWRITTEDDGRKVLEHWSKDDQALVMGASDWRDAAVDARVCPLVATSAPHPDDEHAIVGRSGVLVRMETSRHYYFFCIEGHARLVLYRRENSRYTELAAREMRIDPSAYYRLHLEVFGNRLRAYCNEELIADVFDATLRQGYVGIRTNTMARFEKIEASMTARAWSWLQRTRQAEEEVLAELRSRYPQPVLAHEIDLTPHGGGSLITFGRFGSGASNDLLLQTNDGNQPVLMALTFRGELIWRRAQKGLVQAIKTHDVDGSGTELIAGFSEGHIVVICGADGTEIARRPYPKTGVFQGFGDTPAALDALYIAHLRKTPHASDIVVKECDPGGGHTLWCFDEGLNLRWEATVDQPRHGHHISFYDFDGDGREEVCAGYHLLSPDGEVIWRIEGGRSFDVFSYGRHADSCAGGDFDGDGHGEIAIVGGGEGFMLCDAATGQIIAKHDVGHAQGLAVANFRRDLAGLEIHVGTRWGNYGIRAFYSATGEHLLTFQPDFIGQQGEPVNWSGDGEEFIFIGSSPQAFGFWNAFGQKVVPIDGLPAPVLLADVMGDPRDEYIAQSDNKIQIYTQDRPPDNPQRVYAPIRHKRLGHPRISYENWSP